MSGEKMMRIGLIEVGSRALRFLVADFDAGFRFEPRKIETVVHGIDPDNFSLSDVAKINLLVARFVGDLEPFDCHVQRIYGTAMCRAMEDKFSGALDRAIDVLSTEEEARAAWAAGFICVGPGATDADITVVDEGNGSTEIVRARWNGTEMVEVRFTSLPIGSSALLSMFCENQDTYMQKVGRDIVPFIRMADAAGIGRCVGGRVYFVGGVATKIAWLKMRKGQHDTYNPALVNGARLESEEMIRLYLGLKKMFRDDRMKAIRLVDGRRGSEDEAPRVIASVPFISLLASGLSDRREFLVSGYGLRHGMAFLVYHGLI
jgi:exopolyphosphatase/pppGpp-phosphohydrolase